MGESNPIFASNQPTGGKDTPSPELTTGSAVLAEPPLKSQGTTISDSQPLQRKARTRWWLAPLWATALYLCTHQAAKAAIASALLLRDEQLIALLKAPQTVALDGQRFIQRHYLAYGVYIPLEDIVIRGMTSEEPTIVPLMEQSCGEGQAYVWVPLRFQLPIVGEKVLEWCLVKA